MLAAAAMIGLPAATIAQAPASCMTPQETSALGAAMLPGVVSAVREKCADSLPATSIVRTRGAELQQRYRAYADQQWPAAKTAFIKTMNLKPSEQAVFHKMPDQSLRDLVNTGMVVAITGDLKPADCPKFDTALESLSPLPPQNIATLIGLLMEVGMKRDPSKMTACPTGKPGAN